MVVNNIKQSSIAQHAQEVNPDRKNSRVSKQSENNVSGTDDAHQATQSSKGQTSTAQTDSEPKRNAAQEVNQSQDQQSQESERVLEQPGKRVDILG